MDTRAMYGAVTNALAASARYDISGCPGFDAAQTAAIREVWRTTDGEPAKNFLRGWSTAAIVASIDLAQVTKGGSMIAVWATTVGPKGQIDRAARPLTGNALLVTLGSAEARDSLKEQYNRAAPATAKRFLAEIAKGVALYDGLDGRCGDSWLIDSNAPPLRRYWPLAKLLADDRLWLNSRSVICTQLFAVERAARGGERAMASDCGGRTLTYDAVNGYRSLLASGKTTGIDDGVHIDDQTHSNAVFPFLAPPVPAPSTQ